MMKQILFLNFEKQPGQTSTGIIFPADLPSIYKIKQVIL